MPYSNLDITRVQHFPPALKTLHISPLLEEFGDLLPLLAFMQVHGSAQLGVFLDRPTRLRSLLFLLSLAASVEV